MGQLYGMVKQIEEHIEKSGGDFYESLGLVSMKAGFLLSLIHEDTPDDPEKIAKLKAAAETVLKLRLY